MSEIERWECCIHVIEPDTVYLSAISITKDEKQPESEFEIPLGQMVRMWGRKNVGIGRIGYLVIKERPDGKGAIRGWPYSRKWTQAEIDDARRKGEELFRALTWE